MRFNPVREINDSGLAAVTSDMKIEFVASRGRYAPNLRYKTCLNAGLSVKRLWIDAKDMPNGRHCNGTCNDA